MKTDELVNLLATAGGAVDTNLPARRFTVAVISGLAGAAVLMAVFLGVRDDLALDAALAMFWVKLAFPALLALAGVAAAMRLSRPGAPLARLPAALAAPVIVLWILAAFSLVQAEPARRATLVFGESWTECAFSIAFLSLPALIAMLWAMKAMAPTRLPLAGAAAGLASGALGALVYTLHCPELAAPFLGIWYVIGMLIPAAAGALIGPRVLRW